MISPTATLTNLCRDLRHLPKIGTT